MLSAHRCLLSDVNITNSYVKSGGSTAAGGGVQIEKGKEIHIHDCEFHNNEAPTGMLARRVHGYTGNFKNYTHSRPHRQTHTHTHFYLKITRHKQTRQRLTGGGIAALAGTEFECNKCVFKSNYCPGVTTRVLFFFVISHMNWNARTSLSRLKTVAGQKTMHWSNNCLNAQKTCIVGWCCGCSSRCCSSGLSWFTFFGEHGWWCRSGDSF